MSEKYLFHPIAAVQLVFRRRDLLQQLTKRAVEARYRGSFLGIIWSFAQPLMMLAVYTFVFATVFKAKTTFGGQNSDMPFSLFMLCGMAVFGIFSESINGCCTSVSSTPNYVKKVVFPLEVLPASQVFSTCILNLVWFVLMLAGMLIFVHKIYWTAILLPLVLLPLILFSLGCGFFAASISVYIRDFQYLTGVITQILFFMSPVFYSLDRIPQPYRSILNLNPLAPLIEQTRALFLFGVQPNYWMLAGLTIFSYLVFHLGVVWFAATKKGFADVI